MKKKESEVVSEVGTSVNEEPRWNLGDPKALQLQIESFVKTSGGSEAIPVDQ